MCTSGQVQSLIFLSKVTQNETRSQVSDTGPMVLLFIVALRKDIFTVLCLDLRLAIDPPPPQGEFCTL